MKALALILGLSMTVCATGAFAQETSAYDQNYSGPMNMYGQPTFAGPPPQQPGGQQAPQTGPYAQNGIIPLAAKGAYSVGSYLWSYMPAPLTGAQNPYQVAPGSGQVITNFVPGSR
ncbi:MAG: hypothetical protein HY914_08440 [Desulfomonile tiedjei]|nr:hypothetical protein [Desulfomonile tiedjei]